MAGTTLDRWQSARLQGQSLSHLSEEAPPEILKPLEEAEAQLAQAEKISNEAMEAWNKATKELDEFGQEYGGRMGGLTDRGVSRLKELQLAERDAERSHFQARGLADEARSEFRKAENRFNDWKRQEHQRRVHVAVQQEQTKTDLPRTLRDRIAAFVS